MKKETRAFLEKDTSKETSTIKDRSEFKIINFSIFIQHTAILTNKSLWSFEKLPKRVIYDKSDGDDGVSIEWRIPFQPQTFTFWKERRKQQRLKGRQLWSQFLVQIKSFIFKCSNFVIVSTCETSKGRQLSLKSSIKLIGLLSCLPWLQYFGLRWIFWLEKILHDVNHILMFL